MYLALTRDSAKRILWDDILKTICRDLRIRARFNETELSVRFENGSIIYLLGADSKQEEQDKLLGQKYKTVVVDEAASFRTDLRRLIYKTIEPATIDGGGTIMMIGTPGDFIGPPGEDRHMFYAVTSAATRGEAHSDNEENERGYEWVSFRWNTFDNPHMAEKWRVALEQKLSRIPHFEDTVEYKTEWLGEWCIDHSKLVYKFREDRNLINEAPSDLKWFTIGVDLGFEDATAFHVWGWRPFDERLYGVETVKKKKITLDEVSDECNRLRRKYPQARIVIDGANKQGVEHLRKVYKLPLSIAEKQGKIDFIRHMNTDLVTGRIQIVKSRCAPLLLEWSTLIWDDRTRLPTEKEGCENHAADASLYGWRDALHFIKGTQKKRAPSPWSEEAALMNEERLAAESEDDDDY